MAGGSLLTFVCASVVLFGLVALTQAQSSGGKASIFNLGLEYVYVAKEVIVAMAENCYSHQLLRLELLSNVLRQRVFSSL